MQSTRPGLHTVGSLFLFPFLSLAYSLVVVAHELAHQWFGNLVTMDWWSELWASTLSIRISLHAPI